jgi:hypothetical protein
MHAVLKSLIAAVTISSLAAIASPAVAQKAGAEKAATETSLTPKWLAGHWSAARADITTIFTGYSIGSYSQEYWIDIDVSVLPNGKMEALLTAKQMGDETEFVTWKADVAIANDVATFTPAGIVGKKEWWTYSPQTLQVKRRDNKLMGRAFSKAWNFELDSQLITLER